MTAPIVTIIVTFNNSEDSPIIYKLLSISLIILWGGNLLATEASAVSVEAIALVGNISPNETFDVAVIFTMKDGWHTYWQNPGESGMASSFNWKLPEGFIVLNQKEPVPTRHVDDGITTFIHEEEAIYLFQIQTPDQIPDSSEFSAEVNWLECKNLCRPGSASLSFSLPNDSPAFPNGVSEDRLLQKAELHLPHIQKELLITASMRKSYVNVRLNLKPPDGSELKSVEFFPFEEMVYDIANPVTIRRNFWRTSLRIPLLDYRENDPVTLEGVLVSVYKTPKGQKRIASSINQPIQ